MKTVVGCLLTFVGIYGIGVYAFCSEPMHSGDLALPEHPLSAIAVSQCGGALALFIQLDPNHLLRADPRQSDLFTNVDGKMVQSTAPPMKWDDAINLAMRAVLTTHVTVPCDSGEATT